MKKFKRKDVLLENDSIFFTQQTLLFKRNGPKEKKGWIELQFSGQNMSFMPDQKRKLQNRYREKNQQSVKKEKLSV